MMMKTGTGSAPIHFLPRATPAPARCLSPFSTSPSAFPDTGSSPSAQGPRRWTGCTPCRTAPGWPALDGPQACQGCGSRSSGPVKRDSHLFSHSFVGLPLPRAPQASRQSGEIIRTSPHPAAAQHARIIASSPAGWQADGEHRDYGGFVGVRETVSPPPSESVGHPARLDLLCGQGDLGALAVAFLRPPPPTFAPRSRKSCLPTNCQASFQHGRPTPRNRGPKQRRIARPAPRRGDLLSSVPLSLCASMPNCPRAQIGPTQLRTCPFPAPHAVSEADQSAACRPAGAGA